MKKRIVLFICLLIFTLMFSTFVYAEDDTTAAADILIDDMTRSELPGDVFNYDKYIELNTSGYYVGGSSSSGIIYLFDNVIIGFNYDKTVYQNLSLYLSSAGAVNLYYYDISFTYNLNGTTFTTYNIINFLRGCCTDYKIISGHIYMYDCNDNSISEITSLKTMSAPNIYVNEYNSPIVNVIYTWKYNYRDEHKDFLPLLYEHAYPNGYDATNAADFYNQIQTNVPIFNLNAYCQQYAAGDMTEGFMMLNCLNRTDLSALPSLLSDNVIAYVSDIYKYLTNDKTEYVLGLTLSDVNKYTYIDFTYQISYYLDNSLQGTWSENVFDVADNEFWYNVQIKDTVEKNGFTFDLENGVFKGVAIIQFKEQLNGTTYTFGDIYKLYFTIDKGSLSVEQKYVTVGSNGNANTSTEKDWIIDSGSSGDSSSGSSSSGSGDSFGGSGGSFGDIDTGSGFITTLLDMMYSLISSLGSLVELFGSLFSYLPLEFNVFLYGSIVVFVICVCIGALFHG